MVLIDQWLYVCFIEEGQGLKGKETLEDWPEVILIKVCTLKPYICVFDHVYHAKKMNKWIYDEYYAYMME